ncbi:hypothetical protein IL306_000664 [Fusarium sp. DS 682]|nr:hypothetical protein IL306_000664 [Fusarium sp. DS 682]
MLRQLVKFATTPESNLAINKPSISPDVTIARREAFRCAGAKSPTRGTISCGVTVVAPQTKDKARKTVKSFVTQSPIHCILSAAEYSNMMHMAYHCCSGQNKSNDKRASFENVPEWEDKNDTSSVA